MNPQRSDPDITGLNLTKDAAIMFADIVGSSKLYIQLGNQQARRLIDNAVQVMAQVAAENGGRIIKTLGDEIMVQFPEAEAACEAAITIGIQLAKLDLKIRTGIGFGEIIDEENDVFGDTVNNAAYLAKLAQANQVVMTSEFVNALPPWLSHQCEPFDRIKLKGAGQKSVVYRLVWDRSGDKALNATHVAWQNLSNNTYFSTTMVLEFAGQTHKINSESKHITFGRDPSSVDICIADSKASRCHCSVYFNRGKFVLEDHSTNGTYLLVPPKDEFYLRREAAPLTGYGQFSLGQSNERSVQVVTFRELE